MKLSRNPFNIGIVLFLACGASAPANSVFVSDPSNGTIVQLDSAGNRSIFESGLDNPAGLAFDASGNLYVADSGSGAILKISSTGTESTFASGLSDPTGLAFANNGNLFVANQGDGTIWQFDPNGSGSIYFSGLDFNADPTYLSFDGAGNLYVSGTHGIQKFGPAANASTVFSAFNYVYGVAADQNGDVYASIQNAGSILRVLGTGGPATPLSYPFLVNPFQIAPTGLALDGSGDLYAAFSQLGTAGQSGLANGAIMMFDSNGTGSILATGLNNPDYLAVQEGSSPSPVFVPEPATWSLTVFGLLMVIGILPRRGLLKAGQIRSERFW